MSKITNDGLTRSGTRCLMAVPIWQQWASKVKVTFGRGNCQKQTLNARLNLLSIRSRPACTARLTSAVTKQETSGKEWQLQ